MTQQTPNLGLTYPEAGDHTRIWEHFQTLAEDVDSAVPLIQHGYIDISLDNVTQAGQKITFPRPFASAPTVLSTSNDTYYNTHARNVTAVDFDGNIRHIELTARTDTIRLYWVAFGVSA